MKEMPIKPQRSGFTLLETLVATGIASIIITSALGVIASIYFSQKKVQFSHDFFAESRFLMERIAQVARNNTIDYDNYFVAYGPSCSTFRSEQVPGPAAVNNTGSTAEENRAELGYPTIFYWDTNGDDIQDRNLGGKTIDGTLNADVNGNDTCTQAFDELDGLSRLLLINSARNMRIEVRHNSADSTVSMQRQLGADTDGDGEVDTWAPFDANGDGDADDAGDLDVGLEWTGAECEILVDVNTDGDYNDVDERVSVAGDSTTESWCEQAHIMEVVSPLALEVRDLTFQPAPAYDPYLAFRNDQAQVHPQVFISMDLALRNPDRYGFEAAEIPTLNFQTMVSSRVFGNIRR